MPQKCPRRSSIRLAQTVYPLQGGKVHPNLEKKLGKNFLASTTTRKIRWIYWWNPFLNPLTITGYICNFVTAVSALSNRSLRGVYNYRRVGRYFALGNTFSSCKFRPTLCQCKNLKIIQHLMQLSQQTCWLTFWTALYLTGCLTNNLGNRRYRVNRLRPGP